MRTVIVGDAASGKSEIATALADSLGAAGRRVLYAELDRRPGWDKLRHHFDDEIYVARSLVTVAAHGIGWDRIIRIDTSEDAA
jgi:hypothetical protein